MMKRGGRLILLILIVGAITSVVSNVTVRWLKIRYTYGGRHHYGPAFLPAHTILHGSSLAYSAVDWNQVAARLGGAIDSWAVPGSSPTEWEMNQRRFPDATRTFIVLSAYDLNEYSLCDFRADMVPLSRAIRDLWQTHSPWSLRRRVLRQYPMMVVRKLFPTVGRSDGVMVGVRDALKRLIHGPGSVDAGDAPQLVMGPSDIRARITDWSPGHRERRLLSMRSAISGRHTFGGPKHMALMRLVQMARRQGPVTIVVVPVSPWYQEAFLDAKVRQAFEAELTSLRQLDPQAQMIRLDQLTSLQHNALFSDLVHMNMYGQQIATAAFLHQWNAPRP